MRTLSFGAAAVLGGLGCSSQDRSFDPETATLSENLETLADFPYHIYPIKLAVPDNPCSDCTCMGLQSDVFVGREDCDPSKKYQDWFIVPNRDGTYRLISGSQVGYVLGSVTQGSTVRAVGRGTPDPEGRWVFLSASGGKFRLKNSTTNKCLHHDGTLRSCTTSSRFSLLPKYSFPFSITVKHSSACLNVAGASTADGANVQQYPCGGHANERWYLEPVPSATGQFYVRSLNGSKCLDVANGSMVNNGNVQQYACIGVTNERWRILSAGSDYFYIKNVNSSKCVTVANASTAAGANVDQYDCVNADNQKWRFNYHVPRRLQFVQASRNDGGYDPDPSGNMTGPVQDDILERNIQVAQAVYGPIGIPLEHDAGADRTTLANTTVYEWLSSTAIGTCPDGSQADPDNCVERYINANFPDKIVVVSTKPGNGTSGWWWPGVQLARGPWTDQCTFDGTLCGSPPGPDQNDNFSHMAHEVGHFFALGHTFEEVALQGMPVDPQLAACEGRAGNPALANNVVKDNVMSYYVPCNPQLLLNQQRVVKAAAYYRYASGVQ